MNNSWVICIAREDATSLAALRLVTSIEAAETGTEIWLRGPPAEEALVRKLSTLPARGRFELLAPNQLRQTGQRVPSAQLPSMKWQPLGAWLQVQLAAAALHGHEPRPIALGLVRCAEEREPELLLTSLKEFSRFATEAAQVRLNRLQFAAAADGRVLVRGQPLPPLPGRRFVLHGGVAVPAGFAWEPAVSSEVLARRFGSSGEALVLWNEDGTITRLHAEQWVAATRSAVRDTGLALTQSP